MPAKHHLSHVAHDRPPHSVAPGQRYKITIQYDGSSYAGWQVQPAHRTVQQAIEEALHTITSETVKIHGSGRTDQGVHAWGQVAHFDLIRRRRCQDLNRALNAILNDDIRITKVKHAKSDFHARRSAISKEYRYCIWNGAILPPFMRNYRAHVYKPLDLKAMKAAAVLLIGEHDFAAFTANASRPVESTVRNLMVLSIHKKGHEVVIRAAGNGFLYRMVRSLAGFLIRVGEGALSPETATAILNSRERTAVVPTAPPQGLFLWNVRY